MVSFSTDTSSVSRLAPESAGAHRRVGIGHLQQPQVFGLDPVAFAKRQRTLQYILQLATLPKNG